MKKRKSSDLKRIEEALREVNGLLDRLSTTSSLSTTELESIKERVRRLLAYNPVTGTFDHHTYSMVSLSTASIDDIRSELYSIRDSLMRTYSNEIRNSLMRTHFDISVSDIAVRVARRALRFRLSDLLLYGVEEEDED